MNTLDKLWASTDSPLEYLQGYARYVAKLLDQWDVKTIETIVGLLEQACRRGGTIFCVGNGGSASTASHFATDLAWGRKSSGQRPKVISLAANVPILTAVANDAGYPEIFIEQMRGLFRQQDVLVAISASGNSDNVLRAVRFANEHGGVSIGLVGFDGGQMRTQCTACLHVDTKPGDYEAVEDVHHAVCHVVASAVRRRLAGARPAAVPSGARR